MGSLDDSYRTSTGLQVDQDDLWAHYCDFLGFLWFSHAFIVNQNGHGKQKWNHQSCPSPSLAFSSKTLQPFQTLTDLLKGISSGKPCNIGWRPCANFAANQASDLQEVSGFCGLPLFLAFRLQAKHEKYVCARVCENIPSSLLCWQIVVKIGRHRTCTFGECCYETVNCFLANQFGTCLIWNIFYYHLVLCLVLIIIFPFDFQVCGTLW